MAGILAGLEPEKVFYYFEELSKIPRASKHEKQISDFLYRWAQGKKLEVIQDEALNIIIKKPGTPGYQNSPTVILQGHMDMVCEKNQETIHDFSRDPLKLRLVDDFIYATGTTLGGDDGIAVAFAMAILDSSDIPHPPLEVLITTNEEIGMTGMEKFDSKQIHGKTVINLDSENEGIFTAGCAGGGHIQFTMPFSKVTPKFKNFYKLTIKGLKGGHSGSDIDKERGNAIKLLGRILYDLKSHIEIGEIAGGGKDNAIPRESWAILSVDDATNILDIVNMWNQTLRHELRFSDADIELTIKKTAGLNQVFDQKTKEKIIHLINMVPSGPLSRDLENNLVVSSNNIGGISVDGDKIKFIGLARSSVKSLLYGIIAIAEQLGEIFEVKVDINALYPAWEYAADSPIRTLFLKTYEKLYGIKGKVDVIHAGLECGILMEKIPGLDAISLGPNIIDIHTPDEHLSISSTGRTFKLLCEVLKQLK